MEPSPKELSTIRAWPASKASIPGIARSPSPTWTKPYGSPNKEEPSAMPKVVKASAGDTLCGIGMDNGFLDCAPIRAANPGQDFLSRPLKDGDMVTVPDLDVATESKSTTTTATFVKKRSEEHTSELQSPMY